MKYLQSSMKFISNRSWPYFADIIQESKHLPNLPIEIWLMIEDTITLLVIEDHARRFIFRLERINPFENIYLVPFFRDMFLEKFTERAMDGVVQTRSGARRRFSRRVVHFHDDDRRTTIIYSENDSLEHHCRLRLMEAKLHGIKVIDDF